jgi:aryl-alcohol dehydrogenase-like predicted oxidoreductase
MEQVRLGTAGPLVSAIGFGCMGLSGSYGDADQAQAPATLKRAIELGITFFDTGDFYGGGANEELVGQTLREHCREVVLATKTGIRRTSDGGLVVDGSPKYLHQACDASLVRLGIDCIDLYYLARKDSSVPIEESVGALGDLVSAGKVRYIGLSEVSATTLRRAHATHPVAALQTEYSLWERHVEKEILPAVRELGIGFVAYSPLGRGLLTGTIRSYDDLQTQDFRRHSPQFQSQNLDRNLTLVNAILGVAEQRGCSLAQLALAWLIRKGKGVVPIPGTRRVGRIEENVGAMRVELSSTDFARLDEVMAAQEVHGERYPETVMQFIDH